ncbi:MAG TPA: hypothetical protein VJ840_18770 [Gemmatimonadaceae bacterium]|nr:hypothetical protein [Gemmatimonadaceae bacterium]
MRSSAAAIEGMLSDDFTIVDNSDPQSQRQSQQQNQRHDPAPRDQHANRGDDEPIRREGGEDVEYVDDEGNVRYGEPEDDDQSHDDIDGNADEVVDDPDGQQHEPTGDLKDDAKVTLAIGDGKTETVSLGELKKGYLRTADYTRKTQALAAERTEVQTDRNDVSAEREMLKNSVEAVMRFAKELIPQEPTNAEWETLRIQNPVQYAADKEAWRSFKERLAGVEQAHRATVDGQKAETARTVNEVVRAERQKLADALPEWSDPRVKKADVASIKKVAVELGFTEAEVEATVDHRLLVMALKAAKYDRLMEAKKGLQSKRSQAPAAKRSMDAGTRGSMPTRRTAVEQARTQHGKSQSIASGAALIEKLL